MAARPPSTLSAGGSSYEIFRLDALADSYDLGRLPYTLRILLENVLRNGGEEEVEAVATWAPDEEPSREISFTPARVLLQDFTGVPAVVDLASMRAAMRVPGREGVSRHPRPNRLAHDDGERPRRPRLGRRRHRGRGRDARGGAVDARPAGGGVPTDRRPSRGCDRDGPRLDGDGDPPADG